MPWCRLDVVVIVDIDELHLFSHRLDGVGTTEEGELPPFRCRLDDARVVFCSKIVFILLIHSVFIIFITDNTTQLFHCKSIFFKTNIKKYYNVFCEREIKLIGNDTLVTQLKKTLLIPKIKWVQVFCDREIKLIGNDTVFTQLKNFIISYMKIGHVK